MQLGIILASAAPGLGMLGILSGVLFVIILAGGVLAVFAARRMYRGGSKDAHALSASTPRTDNPTAFVTASMQAVIQKLKEQEKELEALHKEVAGLEDQARLGRPEWKLRIVNIGDRQQRRVDVGVHQRS